MHNSLHRKEGVILLTFSTVDALDSHLHISRYCQPIYFSLPYTFYMGFLYTEKTLLRTYKRSLRGRRFKGMGKGVLGARETRGGARGGREENACQETIVFLVFNIDQANV